MIKIIFDNFRGKKIFAKLFYIKKFANFMGISFVFVFITNEVEYFNIRLLN